MDLNDPYSKYQIDNNKIDYKCKDIKNNEIILDNITNEYYLNLNKIYYIPDTKKCQLNNDFFYYDNKMCCSIEANTINECIGEWGDPEANLGSRLCTMNAPIEYNNPDVFDNKKFTIPHCIIKKQNEFIEPELKEDEKIIVKFIGKNLNDTTLLCGGISIPPYNIINKEINLGEDSKYYISDDIDKAKLKEGQCPPKPDRGEIAINKSKTNLNNNPMIIKDGYYLITPNIIKINNNIPEEIIPEEIIPEEIKCNIEEEDKIIINNKDHLDNKEKIYYYNAILNSKKQTTGILDKANNELQLNLLQNKNKYNNINKNIIYKSKKINNMYEKLDYNKKIQKILFNTLIIFIIFLLFIIFI